MPWSLSPDLTCHLPIGPLHVVCNMIGGSTFHSHTSPASHLFMLSHQNKLSPEAHSLSLHILINSINTIFTLTGVRFRVSQIFVTVAMEKAKRSICLHLLVIAACFAYQLYASSESVREFLITQFNLSCLCEFINNLSMYMIMDLCFSKILCLLFSFLVVFVCSTFTSHLTKRLTDVGLCLRRMIIKVYFSFFFFGICGYIFHLFRCYLFVINSVVILIVFRFIVLLMIWNAYGVDWIQISCYTTHYDGLWLTFTLDLE